ncbi:MAG TPA: hypothetical protein VD837_02370 [Terriglobales bacterium]|nr:hypothetical protein [Terriglobales bacterium]
MFTELRIGQQLVRVDREATAAFYGSTDTRAGAHECTCASCRNFAEQRATAYPDSFVALLRSVGADPAKELEAFDYDFEDVGGMHLYGGWFVLCGEIVEGSEWRPETEPGTFSYWFTNSFPSGGLPTDRKFCAVEFCANIPWVTAELGTPHLGR